MNGWVDGFKVHASIFKTGGKEYGALNSVKNKVVRILQRSGYFMGSLLLIHIKYPGG
jgi:hypothetical protein